jgi:serine phosphatase RsbU (regulator of sigma subunit)
MAAALLMARLSSEVGLLLQTEPDPARVVARLNRSLCTSGANERFITFLLVVLDAGRHELTLVNAGHMPPLIRRSDGRIESIGDDRSGPPLGVMEDHVYEAVTTPVSPGDVAVLYTDGITDAGMTKEKCPAGQTQEGFGDERLRSALAAAPGEVGPTGEAVVDAVRRHAAGRPQFDDMTLICFGRT